MKFHGIEMQGSFKNQIVTALPAIAAANQARLVYNSVTELLYLADNSGNWTSVGQYGDIPLGTTILIESDTVITGYTLETDRDDELVYITKGSVAGGDTGGWAVSGSTWTQPNHTHPAGTYSVPDHNHKWWDYNAAGGINPGLAWASNGVTQINWNVYGISGSISNGLTSHVSSGDGHCPLGDFWTQNTSMSISGSSDNGATANTWRPQGRNFTRQTRI